MCSRLLASDPEEYQLVGGKKKYGIPIPIGIHQQTVVSTFALQDNIYILDVSCAVVCLLCLHHIQNLNVLYPHALLLFLSELQ